MAMRSSIVDKEIRQIRVVQTAGGISSFFPMSSDVSTIDGAFRVGYSTTNCVVLVDVGASKGDPVVNQKALVN